MLDLRFSQRWLWAVLSSGIWRSVVWYFIYISEERVTSIFRVDSDIRSFITSTLMVETEEICETLTRFIARDSFSTNKLSYVWPDKHLRINLSAPSFSCCAVSRNLPYRRVPRCKINFELKRIWTKSALVYLRYYPVFFPASTEAIHKEPRDDCSHWEIRTEHLRGMSGALPLSKPVVSHCQLCPAFPGKTGSCRRQLDVRFHAVLIRTPTIRTVCWSQNSLKAPPHF